MTDTNRLITSSEWLGIGVFSGIAYMVAKYGLKERSFDAESFGAESELVGGPCEICGEDLFRDYDDSMGDVCLSCYYEERSKQDDEGSEYDGWLLNFAESFGAEKINTFSEIENEWKDSSVTIYDEDADEFYGIKEILVQEGDDVLEDGHPYLVLNKDSGDLDSQVFYRDFQTGYDAESFEAEDSRRRLKELMEGKSKEERKRISKMVQVRGLENTIAELLANAEAFAATTFDEDDDNNPKINRDEWMPRTDCEICARPFTINRFGQQLIQHYLKESDNGDKAWKSKKNTDGTRRTARNLAGFFLYEYGLDALNQYVLFQDKTGISDKVIELLRLSLVERVIAGDVVNLIEMMDMGDEVDGEPMFGKKFEKDFGSENN